MSDNKYPSEQYLKAIIFDVEFCKSASIEAVRCMASELMEARAELTQRDAAASDPVGKFVKCGDTWYDTDADDGVKLYTAAQPAGSPVLEQDVKNIIGLLSGNEWAEHCTKSELGRELEGEITRLQDLRAQPQKVVALEDVESDAILNAWDYQRSVFNALDAANVPYEVKK